MTKSIYSLSPAWVRMGRINSKGRVMSKLTVILLIPLCLVIVAAPVHAKLNVFACEPEWAALANELGGKKLKIFSATSGLQDPHRIEARPSLIAKMRRADLVICTGADMEVGWLPLLLRSSGNSKVQVGQPGYVEAAMLVDRLGIPQKVDRSMGDVHAMGNPHVHMDPRRITDIAEALIIRLSELDDANKEVYQERGKQFLKNWNRKISEWQEQAKPLTGTKAIAHHKDWMYLFDWLGIQEIATLEPKPGVPPSAAHLAKLKARLESDPAQFLVRATYQDDKAAKWLHNQTGIPAVELPYTVGGSEQAKDLFSLFDDTINRLLTASQ